AAAEAIFNCQVTGPVQIDYHTVNSINVLWPWISEKLGQFGSSSGSIRPGDGGGILS
ncbi:unnamed protein product, partial [Penicillium manginii]